MPSVKRPAEEDISPDSKEAEKRRDPKEDYVYLLPGHVVKIIVDDLLQVQDPAPGEDAIDVDEDSVLQVVQPIAKSRSAIYEVKIGKMVEGSKKKLVFAADEGRDSFAMKIHMCRDESVYIQPLQDEYVQNTSLLEASPTAYSIIAPTFLLSRAGHQSEVGASDNDTWIGVEGCMILLMPLHLGFDDALQSRRFSLHEVRELFQSGYEQLVRLHAEVGWCHRDVKTDTAVVKAERNEEGVLVPVKPLQILWIDCADAREMETYTEFEPIAGTARYSSVSVVQTWYYNWFLEKAKYNPLINPNILKEAKKDDETKDGKGKDGSASPSSSPKPALPKKPIDLALEIERRHATWDEHKYGEFVAMLRYGRATLVHSENDTWGWGMSLLEYLDFKYFDDIAFPDGFHSTFCESFPADGIPLSYAHAEAQFALLKTRYAPIYDRKSYREGAKMAGPQTVGGCVTSEWWPLLNNMLKRPDVNAHFGTIRDHDKEQANIKAGFDNLAAPTSDLASSTSTSTSLNNAFAATNLEGPPAVPVNPKAKSVPVPKKKKKNVSAYDKVIKQEPLEGSFIDGIATYHKQELPKPVPDHETETKLVTYNSYVCCLPGCNGESPPAVLKNPALLLLHMSGEGKNTSAGIAPCAYLSSPSALPSFQCQIHESTGQLKPENDKTINVSNRI